jgi:hypothetical protein
MTWDVNEPDDNEGINNGDNRIRELKIDLQTALRGNTTDGLEAKFPGADSSNPVYRYRGQKGTDGARPAAGQYGLYFNTTRNVFQRDNSSSWEDVGTVIPAGTKMIFYQASAPVGWTAVSVNDRFLRVVTAGGSGGSTGGTVAASTSLAHSHTVNSHTHTMAHTHTYSGTTDGPSGVDPDPNGTFSGGNIIHSHTFSGTTSGVSTPNTGGSSPGTDSQFAGAFAYADVIICTKD